MNWTYINAEHTMASRTLDNGMVETCLASVLGPGITPDPYVVPDPVPKTIFSVREFRSRFTLAEQVAIRAASLTDMEVGLVYDDFQAAQYIDVTDSDVARGIDLYISKGLLDPDRKAELLMPEAA